MKKFLGFILLAIFSFGVISNHATACSKTEKKEQVTPQIDAFVNYGITIVDVQNLPVATVYLKKVNIASVYSKVKPVANSPPYRCFHGLT